MKRTECEAKCMTLERSKLSSYNNAYISNTRKSLDVKSKFKSFLQSKMDYC